MLLLDIIYLLNLFFDFVIFQPLINQFFFIFFAHRSEWHRHNLNLKMKNLPPIPSEAAFEKLTLEELEVGNPII